MPDRYDVIVIGSGPGGYVGAIRAAQLGQNTAVVERDDRPGGRCLNYACIPAKTILHSAAVFDEARNGAAELGVKVDGVSLDWGGVGKRRDKVRKTLTDGVAMLFDKNKVDYIEGTGSLTADGDVKVGDQTYAAKGVVLATGSVALPIPGIEFGDRVIDTWGAYSLPELPERMAVVGAGASGAEIASAFGRFGVQVTLIEMLDQVLPAEDKDVARVVEREFKKQNIDVVLGTRVEQVDAGKKSVKVQYGDSEIDVDYLCIAGGRAPDTEPLGVADAGVETGDGGRIIVDEYQRTSRDGVFAIGDLVPGADLAHKASEEGVVAVETIAGHPTHPIDPGGIPAATFCHPQVASFGLTEAQARESGREIKVGRFKLGAIGAGTVYDDRLGFVKIVADAEYGEIIGAHIVGNVACDMIAELVDTRELEGGYQELARIIHPHPTISEAVLDAARAVDGWAIHQ
ncbi:MAG TPA: dihydrolipoyl dehydrogenase [Solirubrobacterales bacterium]|jgi:dihydrolipoamide dehydrogenase|nr:dihydrolipoyl dehydrogenase [Solirubrobacterales bacterium]